MPEILADLAVAACAADPWGGANAARNAELERLQAMVRDQRPGARSVVFSRSLREAVAIAREHGALLVSLPGSPGTRPPGGR